MQLSSRHALLLSVGLGTALFMAPGVATAADSETVATTISAVTVYADRAQVTRTGTVELSGTRRYAIEKLPGWIDPESVRATLKPGSGRILDVTVETSFLAEAAGEGVKAADAAVREIAYQLGEIEDEEKVLKDEIARLESLRAFTIDKLPKELATRDISVKTMGDTLGFVSDILRRDRKALRELARRRRELEPELAARNAKRAELAVQSQLRKCTVFLEIEGSGRATLSLTYLTPGATWEPNSELRVVGNGQKVSLTQYATVVQTTGEDWDRAALSFSTQRPGEVLDVPQVGGLLLGRGGAGLGDILGKMDESFGRAAQFYDAQNEVVAQNRMDWADNIQNQRGIQSRVAARFAKIAGRGTTAHFTARTPRNVRADGRPVRVPISASDLAATVRLVGVPEASLNVVRTADLVNETAQPILPGRVSLFDDGAFVGTSEFDFVAPGEKFATFLGMYDRLKLGRGLDRKRSAIERGHKRTSLSISYEVTAENLSDQPITVELADRVAVSQIDDIEVDDVEIPKGASQDADGVVKWTATIAPKQVGTWRIAYTLDYPNDLLARPRQEIRPSKSMSPSAAPQAPSLYDQIEQFEKSL